MREHAVCCSHWCAAQCRDGEAPEQEIFQNSEGQCWDNCTVSALFPAEVSFLTRQCTASFFKAEGLDGHVAALLCLDMPLDSATHVVMPDHLAGAHS